MVIEAAIGRPLEHLAVSPRLRVGTVAIARRRDPAAQRRRSTRPRRESTEGTPNARSSPAAWARVQVPEWAWLIDAALAWRLAGGSTGSDEAPTLADTDGFMH